MSFAASVLRVMIASPSDIPDARDAVEAAINDWNNANATNKQVVLLPWRWETSSVPVLRVIVKTCGSACHATCC